METREIEGSASASKVPARAPGSRYNFRPRSRSATTVPKDRRLGSVETKGAGSTLDLPIAPPNPSSSPDGQNDICTDHPSVNPTLIHDAVTAITAIITARPTAVTPNSTLVLVCWRLGLVVTRWPRST